MTGQPHGPQVDVRIAWLSVHGGAFHKLMALHGALLAAGLSCELLFSAGPPRGLKLGVDVPEVKLAELARAGVHFLDRAEVLRRALDNPPRLLLTDAHHDKDLPALMAAAREKGCITAQMATLLGDFTCHGAQHLLLQHPLTLFFELDYNHTPESAHFARARLHFTGNIFFEPTLNELHGGFASREAFCARYGFDPARPLCLWLPNSVDADHPDYGAVMAAAREAGVNLAVKLHPWEYAFKKHGVDPWGLGKTSDEIWGARAVDEADGSWAFRFCDVAVMRGSATCLEMPFWEKPAVQLPSSHCSALLHAQARLVSRCTRHLSGVDELAGLLAGPLPAFTPADYAAGRGAVRLDATRDAYRQTVAALLDILARPDAAGLSPGRRGLRKLYAPFVTPELKAAMTSSRRLRYACAGLLDLVSS